MTTGFQNQSLGRYGETVAASHLQALGMVLLDRNWSCVQGELDLLLRDGDVLVVCEVKTRKESRHCGPLEAIDDDKLQRLRRLADLYVEATGIRPNGIRIDAVGVTHPRRGKAIVEHVAGVC